MKHPFEDIISENNEKKATTTRREMLSKVAIAIPAIGLAGCRTTSETSATSENEDEIYNGVGHFIQEQIHLSLIHI